MKDQKNIVVSSWMDSLRHEEEAVKAKILLMCYICAELVWVC